MRRERMSRPNSSVPHQCAEEGAANRAGRSMWAGSRGAIHGANRAKMTKITTNTTPVAARGLWRAVGGSEMAMVDILLKPEIAECAENGSQRSPSQRLLFFNSSLFVLFLCGLCVGFLCVLCDSSFTAVSADLPPSTASRSEN